MKLHDGQMWWLATLTLMGCLLVGCDSKVEVPKSAATAFASAKPEIQQTWAAAVVGSQKDDYLGATTNLLALRAQQAALSPEQAAALEELWGALGNKMFAAAEKGDAGAVQAMQVIRKNQPR